MEDDARIGIVESNQLRYKLSARESQEWFRYIRDNFLTKTENDIAKAISTLKFQNVIVDSASAPLRNRKNDH